MSQTNATWYPTPKDSGLAAKVWADGGVIWTQRPVGPTAEVATYEESDDGSFYVVAHGKISGTLEFDAVAK